MSQSRDGPFCGETRHHILVVDDEPTVRQFLADALRRWDYHVTLAGDGEEAIRLLEGDGFALVITDLVMPNEDGIGLILHMQRHCPDVRIIAMSGVNASYLRSANRLGATCALTKPIRVSELQSAILTALEA